MKAKLQNWLNKVNAELQILVNVTDPTVAKMTNFFNLASLREILLNEIGKYP